MAHIRLSSAAVAPGPQASSGRARPIPLVRAAVLKPLVEVLAKRGARVGTLLDRAGLPATIVHHEERLIPLHQGVRFLIDSARTERLPDLGLVAGEAASIACLGVFGRLVRSARTLGEALDTLFEATASFSSGERWWLVVQNGRARLCHTFIDPSTRGHRQPDHYAVALAINLLRVVAGADWTPAEVQLESNPVVGLAERTALFRGTRVLFRQPATTVAFPSEFLAWLLPPVERLPEDTGDDLDGWRASSPAADFAGSVQQVMWALTSENGQPRMRSTAAALGISVRTLQRRLAEGGASFEHLLRADRLRMAIQRLERTDARVLDIALDLGYSDHAHFTRAFRRWTGRTPLEYRRARAERPDDGWKPVEEPERGDHAGIAGAGGRA